jgi:outer membrane lipoprotein-sorting protein
MARTWKRWLPAAVVPAVIAGGVLTGSLQANAAGDLPDKTPQQLLEMMAGSDVHELSGTVEQESALGLPELPKDLPAEQGGQLATALELLTGSHTARIYRGGPDRARLQVFDRFAERDLIRNGLEGWVYNSKENEAVHLILPAKTGGGNESDESAAPQAESYTPEQLADYLLEGIGPESKISVGDDTSVAGRSAYQLVVVPNSTETLVGSMVLAIDAETGMPLDLQVKARGQQEPAFQVAYTKLSLAAPDAKLFEFTPPAGATVTEHAVPQHRSGSEMPQHQGNNDGGAGPGDQVTKHGTGWETITEVPAAALPDGWADSPLLTQASKPVAGGRVISTALVNVYLTKDGRVFAGSVPLEQLQAAAEGR